MKTIYTIIDLQARRGGDRRTPIEDVLQYGEVSAMVKLYRGLGLGAYVRAGWDGKKVTELYEKHGVEMIPHPGAVEDPDPCQVVVDAPDPDCVMQAFLDEFTRIIIRDPTLQFRIRDRYIYGVRVG